MTYSSIVFGDHNLAGYPKIGHFQGIWPAKVLARKMKTRHDTGVAECKKLPTTRVRWLHCKKNSVTQGSLESGSEPQKRDIRSIEAEKLLPNEMETGHDMEVVER